MNELPRYILALTGSDAEWLITSFPECATDDDEAAGVRWMFVYLAVFWAQLLLPEYPAWWTLGMKVPDWWTLEAMYR